MDCATFNQLLSGKISAEDAGIFVKPSPLFLQANTPNLVLEGILKGQLSNSFLPPLSTLPLLELFHFHRPNPPPLGRILPRPTASSNAIFEGNSDISLARKAAENHLLLAMGSGLAPSTNILYGKHVKKFIEFGREIGFQDDEILPCSDHLLCLFLASGIGMTSGGNAKNARSAIRSWHIDNGFPWSHSLRSDRILRALESHRPASSRRDPRPPVTPRMLLCLVRSSLPKSALGACIIAVALVSFWGQLRLGEILPESSSSIDRKRLVSFEHVVLDPSGSSSSLLLPWTKTTRWKGAEVVLTEQKGSLDPTSALRTHLNCSGLRNGMLLCEYRLRGQVLTLDKRAFLLACNEIWSKAGLGSISGHSFRIGGTCALVIAGVDPAVVKQMGRWNSDSFNLYLRNFRKIFGSHANNIDYDLDV